MELTTDIYIVFSLLGLAIFLFATDLLRVDMVGVLMMVLLPLTGVLSAEDAIAGLSSNAVVSIIAVMILGAGLNKTGVMHVVAGHIIKIAGKSENRIMAVISITVAIISSFMQNIGAAALFMPVTLRICRRLNCSASHILMPMGFCAIIGGCLTLVGSSPLIMVNDLMANWWASAAASGRELPAFAPLGLLSVTPIGIALLISALLYFILFGKRVLPAAVCGEDDICMDRRLMEIYGSEVGHGYELFIPEGFSPATLGELEIRPRYHITVVGVAKEGGYNKNLSPQKDTLLEPGDSLWVMSSEAHIERLVTELGWKIKPEFDIFAGDNSPDESGIMEGVVVHHSSLSTHTMEELSFRRLYHVNPLAIVRGEEVIMERINETKLQQGDTILLQGKWKQFRLLKKEMDLALLGEIHGEELQPEKAGAAIFSLLLALVLALVLHVKLSIALLTGALVMILTRVIRADRAYEAVDWRTIFLLAGLIPLGTAFERTGAAAWIAQQVLDLAGTPQPLLLLAIISCLTAFFSLVASNVGATVLMIPLAMNMAASAHTDPVMAALVVAVSASNTFILPTHQVNALIMRPGNYNTRDFIKAGVGMTMVYLSVLLGCLKFFYGI